MRQFAVRNFPRQRLALLLEQSPSWRVTKHLIVPIVSELCAGSTLAWQLLIQLFRVVQRYERWQDPAGLLTSQLRSQLNRLQVVAPRDG